jgi:hypothetical protein
MSKDTRYKFDEHLLKLSHSDNIKEQERLEEEIVNKIKSEKARKEKAEREEKVRKEWIEREEKVRKEWMEREEKVRKEWMEREEKVRKEKAEKIMELKRQEKIRQQNIQREIIEQQNKPCKCGLKQKDICNCETPSYEVL